MGRAKFVVTINAYDPIARNYGLICDTRAASTLEDVQDLFIDPGKFGMNYKYQISERENGEQVAFYYSDRFDLANSLRPI